MAGGRDAIAGPRVTRIVTRRRAIAGGVLAAGLLGVGTWLGGEWHPNVQSGRYVTDVGEMRRIGLTDGSEIVLNTASETLVTYTGNRRALRLARGETFFTVAKNNPRPFLVYVGRLIVRATGASFIIRRIDADLTHITVMAGSIELLWTDGVNREPRRLSASQQATAGIDGVIETHTVPSDELQHQSSWLSGRIVFNGQPLHEAIREMNLYSHFRLVVEDSALAERPVVGAFRPTDTQGFISALQQSLDVESVSTGDTVLLHPRAKSR